MSSVKQEDKSLLIYKFALYHCSRNKSYIDYRATKKQLCVSYITATKNADRQKYSRVEGNRILGTCDRPKQVVESAWTGMR